MISNINRERCTGCAACMNICAKKAITMKADEEGFFYPQIEKSKCVNCKACENVCPVMHSVDNNVNGAVAFAVKSRDPKVLSECSSGGVFAHIAQIVLHNNGVVFGAAFDDILSLKHQWVDKPAEANKLYGSKYVQSEMQWSYTQCREHLERGKIVLFSGTPCQISGLLNFLRRDYENLLTVETICHGVPSPFVFKRHIDSLQKQVGKKITDVSFRDKSTGWESYSLHYQFIDGKKMCINHHDDKYMKAFLRNLSIRPSCYSCAFKSGKSGADLTLGDFWGIEQVIPDLEKKDGVSLVICNTQKGNSYLTSILNDVEKMEVEKKEAVQLNPSYFRPPTCPGSRQLFFLDIRKKTFSKCVDMYCSDDKRMIQKIQFKEDCFDVRQEKGSLFLILWVLKNGYKYL